jgi:hypothetical protein
LTIIGAGPEQTIIGPEHMDDHTLETYGIGYRDITWVSISGLKILNIKDFGLYHHQGHLEIENCVFENGDLGIFGHYSGGANIRDCRFENLTDTAVEAHPPTNDVLVEDCQFLQVRGGCGFGWAGTQNCRVINCTFNGGITGLAANNGATVEVRGCTFSNHLNYAMAFSTNCAVEVRENIIEEEYGWGIHLSHPAFSVFRDNIIYSALNCLGVSLSVEMEFRNNHILRGPNGYFARTSTYYPYTPFYIDVRYNWWGTTDLDEIAEWIYDGYDDPNVNLYFEYVPILDGPVPVESASWGEVKSRYR